MRKIANVFRMIIFGVGALVVIVPVALGVIYWLTTMREKPPNASTAPWEIQTSSLLYYGEKFSIQQGIPELKGYWILSGKRYIFEGDNSIIKFDPKLYGTFGVNVILVQRTISP